MSFPILHIGAKSTNTREKRNEDSTMISKMFRITLTIAVASLALGSAAGAMAESPFRPCSNASLRGVYGALGVGTNPEGEPEGNLFQFKLDSFTGKYTGVNIGSDDGVIETASVSGTYSVASDCTVTGTTTKGASTHPFSGVLTSIGLQTVSGNPGATNGGFWVAQGSPTCSNAGVKGSFGLAARGTFLAGAPFTGPAILIGELALSVNDSGEGVISGHIAGSGDGTIFSFAEEPVTGSYSVDANCTGTLTITPTGESALTFRIVIVDYGKEMLALETNANTVVTATLQR
jgi:hypothetical protein